MILYSFSIKYPIFLLVIFFMVMPGAYAQALLEDYKKPMPEIEFLPEEKFFNQTVEHSDIPMNNDNIAYSVRIPKDWARGKDLGFSSDILSSKILTELTRFHGPPKLGFRSFFTIQASGLEHSLSAEQWFLQHLLSNGYAVQGFVTHSAERAEALYVTIKDNTTYAVRAVAITNGKNVILSEYFLPSEFWEEEKGLQAQAMSTFKLTNISEEPAEPMLEHQFLDIATFQYPQSWELRASPIRSIDRMDVELFNINSEEKIDRKIVRSLDGKIRVFLTSYFISDSLESEIESIKKKITDIGFSFDSKIEVKDNLNIHDDFDFAQVEVYNISNDKNKTLDYEFWLTSMAAGEYYYFVTLITPSRDQDYFVWARNVQTYNSIISLIEPQVDSVRYD